VRVATVTVTVLQNDGGTLVWEGLPPDPDHQRDGAPDSLKAKFASDPSNLAQKRTLPIVLTLGSGLADGLAVVDALVAEKPDLAGHLNDLKSSDADRSVPVELSGGNDGERPTADDYRGKEDEATNTKTGLLAFEDIEDISIVAAPGSTFGLENEYRADATSIVNLLIAHAERMRYRIAVLDSGNEQSIALVRAMRAKMDSKYAALYYPWVRVLDPVTRTEIYLPPSGFVAGIYARNDINRAVYKAPANEVVNGAIGFEFLLNKSQQDILNPEGINCFRFFEGRGFRLWGARTISSDPEWKYVNLRRYFAYLERSIDKGTQWAVFEPNGEQLWGNVRRTIEDFLLNEFQMGALLGEKPEKAYFVKCDRSTMTQNDLDNGRLVCLIGVAALRPAEFVIFRIGQWKADRKV
jgi:phage tail sheath protein FI